MTNSHVALLLQDSTSWQLANMSSVTQLVSAMFWCWVVDYRLARLEIQKNHDKNVLSK